MTKGGYSWSIGGPLPTIEDHSRAKHDVLRAYLVNYLRILAQHPKSEGIRVTLVDGFAGGGQYRSPTGSVVGGSPLVVLEALQEVADWLERRRKQCPEEQQRFLLLTDGRLKEWSTLPAIDCPGLLIDIERGPIRLGRSRQMAAELNAGYVHIDG